MLHWRQQFGCTLVGLATLAWIGSAVAAGPRIEQQTRIRVAVRSMGGVAETGEISQVGKLVLEPGRGEQSTRLDLRWPGDEDRCSIEFRASASEEAGGSHRLELRAFLRVADGRRIDAARTVFVEDRLTTLFEVYRRGEDSLTLAIEAEAVEEEVISTHPTVGLPVRFKVEVIRVGASGAVSLEDNFLNTFIGEPVFYEFTLGEEADSVRLTLKPLRMIGSVAEIEIGLSGSLPDIESGEARLLARTERWLASRNATSKLSFETGDPPTGYRFLVTARF